MYKKAMESSTKEVTIDAVRCEEVHFHAETNGDEKNILISFNELVTNFPSNSKELPSSNGASVQTIANPHAKSNDELPSLIAHDLTKSKDYTCSNKMSNDHAKSGKDNSSSNNKQHITSAPPHLPYRFVRRKESDKTKHKDSQKELNSSKLKMKLSLAPHIKLTHPYAKQKELSKKSMLADRIGDSSCGKSDHDENARDAVLKIALDSLTDVQKSVPNKVLKKTKVNDGGVGFEDKLTGSSLPNKNHLNYIICDEDSNNSSQSLSSSDKHDDTLTHKRNVKVETSENNISTDQSSSHYESFHFEPLPSFCDKSFGQTITITTDSPIDDKGFTCKFCNKSFARERYLKMHQKVHSEERPYKCNTCNKTFRWRSNLTEHQHIHNDKPFQCGVCKQEFSQLSEFRHHQLLHSEERPVKCQCCDKSFDDPRDLKTHYQTHSVDRPYKCTVCDKAFRWRSNLTGHMHIHNINKPYRCEICMQGFTQISNYKNHQVLHSGEKPHKCPECDKTFAQARYLKTHLKLHSEERPYECKHCGKAFRWPGNLRGHLQLHKQDKPHKCEQCGTSFSQYASLSRHLNHHCSMQKRCDVPSQTFLDNLDLLIQKRQQSKEHGSDDELGKGEGQDKLFTQTSTLLDQISKENCKEIHVVFKQHEELQPRVIEEEKDI